MKRFFYQVLTACVGLGMVACSPSVEEVKPLTLTADAKTGAVMDVPTLFRAYGTKTTVGVRVTAGATGAEAGFSLQWMPAAAYAANGNVWNDNLACKASFSGNARDSRYRLAPFGSVVVNVGALLLDNGASTSCNSPLTCGSNYVFRVFAHANNTAKRSDFSVPAVINTNACVDELPSEDEDGGGGVVLQPLP